MAEVSEDATIGHLTDLLDRKNEENEALQEQLRSLEAKLENAIAGWSLPRKAEERPGLPVPRLEIEWMPSLRDGVEDWRDYKVEYRLVYRHFTDDLMLLPLGVTRVRGGTGRVPYSLSNIELPIRDGCHAHHDSTHLRLPLYAITPSEAILLDSSKDHERGNYTHSRALGMKHRTQSPADSRGAGLKEALLSRANACANALRMRASLCKGSNVNSRQESGEILWGQTGRQLRAAYRLCGEIESYREIADWLGLELSNEEREILSWADLMSERE